MTKCTTLLLVGFAFAVNSAVCVNESHAAFGTANLTYAGLGSGTGVSPIVYSDSTGSQSGSSFVGALKFTVNTSTNTDIIPVSLASGDFMAFCIELKQTLNSNTPYEYVIDSVQNAPNPPTSSPLPGGHIGAVREGYLTKLYDLAYDTMLNALSSSSSSTRNANAAAFQLAIWELSHETSDPLHVGVSQGDGTFYLDASPNPGTLLNAINLANNWLAAVLNPNVTVDHKYDLYALTNKTTTNTAQDLIFAVPAGLPGSGVVPEATAMVTWAMILFSASVVSRPARRQEMA